MHRSCFTTHTVLGQIYIIQGQYGIQLHDTEQCTVQCTHGLLVIQKILVWFAIMRCRVAANIFRFSFLINKIRRRKKFIFGTCHFLIGAGWVNSDIYSLSQTTMAYKPLTPLYHHPTLPRTHSTSTSTPHPHHSPLIIHASSLTLITHTSSLTPQN